MNKIIYKEGDQLGEAIFIRDAGFRGTYRLCIARCKCGNEFEAVISSLKLGRQKHCGCIPLGHGRRSHGMSTSTEYGVWLAMRARCLRKNNWKYKTYGGAGIKICDRWKDNFQNFYDDMGPRPSSAHTLDRWPNKGGNYEPSNCRWATAKEQANNTKKNINITYLGTTKTAQEWGRIVKMQGPNIAQRFKKGWPPKYALTVPPSPRALIDILEDEKLKVRHSFGVINY